MEPLCSHFGATLELLWSYSGATAEPPVKPSVAPSTTSQKSQDSPRELRRSPYLWAALAGLILIPAMRPLLRFEPAPPPLYGRIPHVRLADQHGRPMELGTATGDAQRPVLIAGFLGAGCAHACAGVLEALTALDERLRSEGVAGIEAVAIALDPDADTPAVLGRRAAERDRDGGIRLLSGEPAAIRSLLRGFRAGDPRVLLESAPGVEDPAARGRAGASEGAAPARPATPGDHADPVESGDSWRDRLVLVDPAGGLRGSYGLDAAGIDEVFHRAQHVRDERRPPQPARMPARAPG